MENFWKFWVELYIAHRNNAEHERYMWEYKMRWFKFGSEEYINAAKHWQQWGEESHAWLRAHMAVLTILNDDPISYTEV